ncbi:helix-turn-helix domain-containing protein [Methylocapsa aurea]|uniref:helix-turn-helix domain-containing protein n=1 Tax=Methylocapsa aurea TaxID=663610 RepID=UPI0009FD6AB7
MSILKISIRQIKAARELLAWSQVELAERSGVSLPTVRRLEAQDGVLGGRAETGSKIIAALESAGVIFVEENGEGAGVRLKKRSETVADLTGQIDALEADMTPDPTNEKPSPKRGMKQLRRAHDLNELAELKNRRRKSRTQEKE